MLFLHYHLRLQIDLHLHLRALWDFCLASVECTTSGVRDDSSSFFFCYGKPFIYMIGDGLHLFETLNHFGDWLGISSFFASDSAQDFSFQLQSMTVARLFDALNWVVVVLRSVPFPSLSIRFLLLQCAFIAWMIAGASGYAAIILWLESYPLFGRKKRIIPFPGFGRCFSALWKLGIAGTINAFCLESIPNGVAETWGIRCFQLLWGANVVGVLICICCIYVRFRLYDVVRGPRSCAFVRTRRIVPALRTRTRIKWKGVFLLINCCSANLSDSFQMQGPRNVDANIAHFLSGLG